MKYWLEELRKHSGDFSWIASREKSLYRVLLEAVNRPRELKMAYEALELLHPYVRLYGSIQRWRRVWIDAILSTQDVNDIPILTRLWEELSKLYFVTGDYKGARGAIDNSLERAKARDHLEGILSGKIEKIRQQAIHQDGEFTKECVKEALKLAQYLDSAPLWAKLHQALAMAYNVRKDTRMALAHGQTAYAYWHKLGDNLQMARMAMTLAQACRTASRFENAKRFLNISRTLYSHTPSGARLAVLDYEQGLLCLDMEKYDQAAQWLTCAYQEFRFSDQRYYLAASHHSLGIAQSYLKQYDEAVANFDAALKLWKEMDNWYEQANLYHAIAECEKNRGEKVKAVEYLVEGLEICTHELLDSAAVQKLKAEMEALVNEISRPPRT